MLARNEVVELINTQKVPEAGSEVNFDLSQLKNIFTLVDVENDKVKFKLDVTQNNKVALQLSCHHRNEADFGLIRIDYNGPSHTNPQTITPNVPLFLKSYAGVKIEPRVAHIHIYVEEAELNWAMPLQDYIKLDETETDGIYVSQLKIDNQNDKQYAIRSFNKTINLKVNSSFTSGLFN
jgi:hypothetical protein